MQHFAKETIIRLAKARVEFVVVGGLSAVRQGVPIVTSISTFHLRAEAEENP
jgi:hypothetical protein